LIALLFVAGCGSQTPTAPGRSAPATDATLGTDCPPPLAVVPPSPANPGSPSQLQIDQEQLQGDVVVIEHYAVQHSDEWGGLEFDNAKIKVAFTGHVPEHRAALERLVAHPGALEVVGARWTKQHLDTIAADIEALADPSGQIPRSGAGSDVVDIGLAPGREDLAARYAQRWGSAVSITVGAEPYVPAGCGPQPTAPRCPALSGADPASAKLQLRVVLDAPALSRYVLGTGHLVVRNVGSSAISMDVGQPVLGAVVTPGTANKVGGDVQAFIAGAGDLLHLAPGEEGQIPLVVGAGRCDGRPGSALPPGPYSLRVVLPDSRAGQRDYLSAETAINISDAPPPVVPDPPDLPPVPITAARTTATAVATKLP
jgi:hypothetical protein